MRQRAFALFITACLFLLAACDLTGLPTTPTPTPPTNAFVTVESTPTSRSSSRPPTVTAIPNGPRSTSTPDLADPTGTVEPTVVGGSAQLSQNLLQIEEDAAALRGLQPKDDVSETFITQSQLRTNLTNDMQEDYPTEEARRDAVALWLLRLSSERSLDLNQLYLDLLTEGVAGYYDQEKDELFVLGSDSDPSPSSRETLAHEFVHSLQDQHYDLQRLLPEESKDDDRNLAARSLVEGDATLAGLMYAVRRMTQEEFQQLMQESQNAPTDVLDRAPAYIRESLLFPYDQGSTFVSKLIEQGGGGFEKVNAALADPPSSTEQIMHPEKYMQLPRDEPVQVALPPLTATLGTGWKHTDNASFGEFDLGVLLRENGASDANEAAAGWGGGQYSFYENGDQALLILGTEWDTAKDADEFEAALAETLAQSQKAGELWRDDGRVFGLKRTGDSITLISATDPTLVEKALAEVK